MDRSRPPRAVSAVLSLIGVLVSAAACGDPDPADDTPADSGPLPPAICDTDSAAIASRAPPEVSFRRDVMPIFGQSCNLSACHDPDKPEAELRLGVRCVTANGRCVFPDAPGARPNDPQPLTEDEVTVVLANLVDVESRTVPGLNVVTRGDIDQSFLVRKIAGDFRDQGYVCTDLDPTDDHPCGVAMPWNSPALCLGTNGQARFDLIAAWIIQGAQDN
jgi:hypothetical protein